jgi:two-component system KDP operon response regulator KdpE
LLASLGHDLRTPLTAIRVAASNLQASWLHDADRREQSDLILAEVERLNRLFQNILEMARIDSGAVAADVRWVHPAEIFEAACDQVETRSASIAWISTPTDHLSVSIPPSRLRLAHSLENAVAHGARCRIVARVGPRSGLEITVRDTARALPRWICPTCLNASTGAEAKRRVSGTGHGTLDCARDVGGRGRPNRGRKLRGRRRTIHDRRSGGEQGGHGRGAGIVIRAARILLVDDEVPIQRAVAPLLRSRGYEVDVVGTGAGALSARAPARSDRADLGLPDEGTEVRRRIREDVSVPIVVLSARGAEADKVLALDLGADDYVTKPFGPEELLARIRVALRRALSSDQEPAGRLRVGDLTIDYDRHRVSRDHDEIRLTPKEFELLVLLARSADRCLRIERS